MLMIEVGERILAQRGAKYISLVWIKLQTIIIKPNMELRKTVLQPRESSIVTLDIQLHVICTELLIKAEL